MHLVLATFPKKEIASVKVTCAPFRATGKKWALLVGLVGKETLFSCLWWRSDFPHSVQKGQPKKRFFLDSLQGKDSWHHLPCDFLKLRKTVSLAR